jgi:hypothetical protein
VVLTTVHDPLKRKRSIIRGEKLNRIVLSIFAPVLIVTGIAGFLVPPQHSLTSGAAPYNIFHIAFGVIGLLIVLSGTPRFASFFNLVFGLIDLYQAVASFSNLPPKQFFLWTSVDDILHVLLGAALFLIGLYGILKQKGEIQ